VSTDATIVFKEWLPDLPDLDNPGLIEALNVVPIDSAYEPFRPLTPIGVANNTVGSSAYVAGAFLAQWNNQQRAYAALDLSLAGATVLSSQIYASDTSFGGYVDRSPTSSAVSSRFRFAQFDDLVIAAVGSAVYAHTFGAGTAFTALATNGAITTGAQHVGVINKFVFVGGGDSTGLESSVRWSGFDAPRNWPAPNSTTAIAQQSGQEPLDASLGLVTGIAGGDQFGIVFQQTGITRVTYIGPPAVFQFDQYERGRGLVYPNSLVQFGGVTYFISEKGFCVTDGVQVIEIGDGKVNEFWRAEMAALNPLALGAEFRVCGGADLRRGLVYWAYPSSGLDFFTLDRVLIYNTVTKRWAHATQDLQFIASGIVLTTQTTPIAFDDSRIVSTFSGTAGSAVLTTAETEINPGGLARVSGVKPLIGATANAVTVALGTRNNRTDAVTYTAESTANSRSGFCDFRSEARYHRARVTITGTFNAAQGIEVDAVWSGAT
jgi:hypothetical protein